MSYQDCFANEFALERLYTLQPHSADAESQDIMEELLAGRCQCLFVRQKLLVAYILLFEHHLGEVKLAAIQN